MTTPIDPIPSDFLQAYKSYIEISIRPLHAYVDGQLGAWREDGFWSHHAPFDHDKAADPRPIQRLRTREKRIESVRDKIKRQSATFSDGLSEESLKKMHDLFGARVVVFFPRQVAMIDRELRKEKQFRLVQSVSPKAYLSQESLEHLGLSPDDFDLRGQKPSGYSSLHYILTVPAETNLHFSEIPFELQVRTMLEETWSEIDHQLGYKPDRHTAFSVRRQFKVISDHLRAVDQHFDFLYDHLSYQQQHSQPEDADPLNAENFPSVMDGLGLSCEQGAIGFLIAILDAAQITTVGRLRAIAQIEVVDAIRHTYEQETKGKIPSAKDVVPVVARLSERATASEAANATKQQLGLVDMMRDLGREP